LDQDRIRKLSEETAEVIGILSVAMADTGTEADKAPINHPQMFAAESRQELGIRDIVDDENVYAMLKLLAMFARKAGHTGLYICLDEMVVLSHRLPSSRARQANYEALLTILNDCFQGGAQDIGFLLAGTDEFLEDRRRGLFSYEALRSRLADNQLSKDGAVDLSGPVIRLAAAH
jgi:hypothetical protein